MLASDIVEAFNEVGFQNNENIKALFKRYNLRFYIFLAETVFFFLL
jgi:hypothetical protein